MPAQYAWDKEVEAIPILQSELPAMHFSSPAETGRETGAKPGAKPGAKTGVKRARLNNAAGQNYMAMRTRHHEHF